MPIGKMKNEKAKIAIRFASILLLGAVLSLGQEAWAAVPLYVISTVAGTGTIGYGGDGGMATAALINAPTGVATDGFGNLFIADSGNSVIRRVDYATGIISTVAGNGNSAYGGDGGPATAAQLNNPIGVALDAQGNLYVADTGNHRIRRIDHATQSISTVVGSGSPFYSGDGGLAVAASLYNPTAVMVDGQGNIFVADTGNSRIRRVDYASGVIATVAGNGSDSFGGDGGPATAAGLSQPKGVAMDSQGNLFIADTYNLRVRRVDHATSIISTVAGSATTGSGGDGGLAVEASLNYPGAVVLDRQDNLFIIDSASLIRRVEHDSGIINTIAGNGGLNYGGDDGPALQAGFYAYSGIALDAQGNIFLADYGNQRVRKIGLVTASPAQVECLLNWAESSYPDLFSPAGSMSQIQSPYVYRYYASTNSYVGVSFADSHAYYLGSDGVLQDAGDWLVWLALAKCQ